MLTEPVFKTRIIHNFNTDCAMNKSCLVVRIPQPNATGHATFSTLTWTADEASAFLADHNKLPRDITTLDATDRCVRLWFFDASGTGGLLPALELDPKPMLERFPGLCIFDMSGDAVPEKDRKVALIPSTFLRLFDVGGNKVQFVLDEGGDVGSFTTSQAKLGAQMSGA